MVVYSSLRLTSTIFFQQKFTANSTHHFKPAHTPLSDIAHPPVELLVVTGLDEKARIYVDQNAKRSAADMLKIVLNQSVTARMAAIVNTHLKLDVTKSDIRWNHSTSKPELNDVVEAMAEYAETISLLISAGGMLPRAGTYCALLHYAIRYNEDAAIRLAQSINSGEGLRKTDPAYKLREYLIRQKNRGGYGSAGQLEDYKVTVTTCIADANKEDLQVLRSSNNWIGLPKKLSRHIVKSDGTKVEAKAA